MKNLENKEIFARNLRRFLDARGNRAGLGINKYGISTDLIIRAPGFSQPALKLFFYCI